MCVGHRHQQFGGCLGVRYRSGCITSLFLLLLPPLLLSQNTDGVSRCLQAAPVQRLQLKDPAAALCQVGDGIISLVKSDTTALHTDIIYAAG